MRRFMLVLLAAGMAVVALAGLAQAKPGEGESEEVSTALAIAGPGLSGAITLDPAATAAYEDVSNLFNPTSRMHVRPSAVDLGPKFELLLTMVCSGSAGSDAASIRQDLYPYASFRGVSQVWTYTPADQRPCQQFGAVAGGWNAARRGLFDTLTAAGLPRTAPISAPVSAPIQSPIAQPDRFWPLVWTIAGLLCLVAIGVAQGRPGRKRARVLG